MAGHSRRFKEAGYDIPKPFIMVGGQPMIARACQMFSPTDEFIFVCNKEHLLKDDFREIISAVALNYYIVEIDPHEYGPVYSTLQAESCITDADEPIIVTYSDFTIQWNYRQFLLKAALYEGAIAVFRGFHPASFGNTYYAYIKADKNLEMLELREKQSFTENRTEEFASTGVYYIENWRTFKHYAEELLKNSTNISSEYYCSLIFNPMVRDGKKVCLFEVDKFICWGTPQDLEEYNFWSEYFSRDAKQILSHQI